MRHRHVHIVHDRGEVRRSTTTLLRAHAVTTDEWPSGSAFLARVGAARPGCVLVDGDLPGEDGLTTLQNLTSGGIRLPVVMLTGHGDVGAAITAMKAGATDVVEKPVRPAALLSALDDAMARVSQMQRRATAQAAARARLATLTAREHDVLRGLVEGLSNKAMAQAIGISPRTIEIHRANVLRKLDATSLSQVVRVAYVASAMSAADDGSPSLRDMHVWHAVSTSSAGGPARPALPGGSMLEKATLLGCA